MKNFILPCFLLFLNLFFAEYVLADYSLACNPGYRLSAIKRANSAHQRGKVGSLLIECQPLMPGGSEKVKCAALDSAPQCNGSAEGCAGAQWIGGFNVYKLHNETNAILLDPICCEAAEASVDQLSCATERLNSPRLPFEHVLPFSDFVYRSLQCWHQYDTAGSPVDMIWKVEICQISVGRRKAENGTAPPVPDNCPPCECHCGINLCGNGAEPIRVIHKSFVAHKCSCDCICRYECVD